MSLTIEIDNIAVVRDKEEIMNIYEFLPALI